MKKAHSHRRLHMSEISILQTRDKDISILSSRPLALIDPICDTIEMNENVATARGIKKLYGTLENFTRRARIEPSDRQTVEVSISHDGDIASAVCMAFDPPDVQQVQTKNRRDDGIGAPMHEPQWGDKGWLTYGSSKELSSESNTF